MPDLVLSSIGVVSSVGRDLKTTCASVRAGITRAVAIEHFCVVDEEEHEMVPMTAHAISGITDGFSCLGRWLQMARYAFADMLQNGNLPSSEEVSFWGRIGVIFVTPVLDDRRFLFVPEVHVENIQENYTNVFLESLPYPIDKKNQKVISIGNSGTISAIIEAETWMQHSSLKGIILVATDSLIDSMSLLWFGEAGRLKPKASGLVPGEAAVCLFVEFPEAAVRRGGMIFARFIRKAIGLEENHFFSGNKNHGRAMSGVLHEVLRHSEPNFSGDLYIDLNGEAWRAVEYAHAMVRLSGQLDHCKEIIPAIAVGDIGSASGAFGVALAVGAYQRNCATSDQAMVLSSSEYGEVGALLISRG